MKFYFLSFLIFTILVLIFDFLYFILFKKFNILIMISIALAVVSTIVVSILYRKYRILSDFDIKIDNEGIFFKIPKPIAEELELEVQKGKYLWRQIKNVQYDSENHIIYLVLISKIKIPIPLVGLRNEQIEEILSQISKYTSVEVV
ncbi:MAG: hypothetical protein ABIL49_05610 [candidate division WOR-3 bacterium]